MDTDDALTAAAVRAEPLLRRIPGVTGVGVGPKRAGGVALPVAAIQVYVERKRPLSELDPGEVVPDTIEGYPTNVSTLRHVRYAAVPAAPPGEPVGFVAPPLSQHPPPPEAAMGIEEPVLIGGGPISSRVDETARGTLGLLVHEVTDANKVYALTCYHVLCEIAEPGTPRERVVAEPARDKTLVGQIDPNGSFSCSHCCDDAFGTFVQGELIPHSWRDMALVRLKPGTRYIGSIKQLGRVRGIVPALPTTAEMAAKTYRVRKYGNRTGRTGGWIGNTKVTPAAGPVAQFIVVPHVTTGTAPDHLHFGLPGDSGAAVVTPDGLVVGILDSVMEADAKEYYGPDAQGELNVTLIAPFVAIQFRFKNDLNPKFDITPVLAADPCDFKLVPAAVTALLDGEQVAVLMPGAASVAGTATPAARAHGLRERVRAELSASPLGADIVRLWERHSAEVVDLVNNDRRVLTAWHRSGASAVYQRLTRQPGTDGLTTARLPHTVNGEPLSACVARMHEVLARQGSTALRMALDGLVPRLPDLAGLTYPQILAALASAAPYEPAEAARA